MKYNTIKNQLTKLTIDNKNLKNSLNFLEYKNQVYDIISPEEEPENGKNISSNNFYKSEKIKRNYKYKYKYF